jgi:hypothetical protein
VLAAAEKALLSREQRLWDEVVDEVLGSAATLEPAARSAVRAVLESLVDDPTESAEAHRDVLVLLDAGTALEPMLHDADDRPAADSQSTVQPRSLRQRLLGLIERSGYQAGVAAGR